LLSNLTDDESSEIMILFFNNKPEGRAQLILIWMVLIEIVRIRGDPISSLVGNYENQQSNWLQDHSQTTPIMSSGDYIVMGEENFEVTVCDKGYCWIFEMMNLIFIQFRF
jgi:hypothetical protein